MDEGGMKVGLGVDSEKRKRGEVGKGRKKLLLPVAGTDNAVRIGRPLTLTFFFFGRGEDMKRGST